MGRGCLKGFLLQIKGIRPYLSTLFLFWRKASLQSAECPSAFYCHPCPDKEVCQETRSIKCYKTYDRRYVKLCIVLTIKACKIHVQYKINNSSHWIYQLIYFITAHKVITFIDLMILAHIMASTAQVCKNVLILLLHLCLLHRHRPPQQPHHPCRHQCWVTKPITTNHHFHPKVNSLFMRLHRVNYKQEDRMHETMLWKFALPVFNCVLTVALLV